MYTARKESLPLFSWTLLCSDILFHHKIKKGKAVHGNIAVPETVPFIPFPLKDDDYGPSHDAASAVVVCLSDDAMTLIQLDKNQLTAIETFVFIDYPWQKAPSILNHTSLSH